MPFDAHSNLSYGSVLTPPSPAASGTTIVLAAGIGSLMPTAPFNALVWPAGVQPLTTNAEIVRVTARTTDTLTIVRAQEGTSARTILAGDQFCNVMSAKVFTDIEAVISPLLTGTQGDIVYFSATNVMGKLPAVAVGQVLISQGVGAAPAWGQVTNAAIANATIDLTTKVTGALPDANIASATNWNSKQAGSASLTSLAALSFASLSFVKMTAAGTFALDTNTYLTANQTITLTGDVSGSGATAITTTIGALKVTNAMLAGSIDLTTKVTGLLPDGNISSAATWNAKQAGSASLTSLSGLTYASLSFVKMTAAGAFALDTNTYLTSSTGVSSITGTVNQITASAATGAVTLSLPVSVVGINSLTSAAASNLVLGTGTFGTALTFASATGAATFAGVASVQKSQAGLTTVGAARQLRLSDVNGATNNLTEIGFGFDLSGASAYQPVVIGHKVTNTTGNTSGSFYIATRALQTDTAPIVQVTVASTGEVAVSSTTDATTGGAGSLTTAGGIYAAKKIISATDISAASFGATSAGTGAFTTLSTTGVITAGAAVIHKNYTVATLPAAASNTYGIVFITDSTATAITGLGLAPVGGGANVVPCYSDGGGWKIL
jgi:hypothetical protein